MTSFGIAAAGKRVERAHVSERGDLWERETDLLKRNQKPVFCIRQIITSVFGGPANSPPTSTDGRRHSFDPGEEFGVVFSGAFLLFLDSELKKRPKVHGKGNKNFAANPTKLSDRHNITDAAAVSSQFSPLSPSLSLCTLSHRPKPRRRERGRERERER